MFMLCSSGRRITIHRRICNEWLSAFVSGRERETAMQAICSIAATILALTGPGECKTSADGTLTATGSTSMQYAVNGLPRLPSLPKLPSVPHVPKPKWP